MLSIHTFTIEIYSHPTEFYIFWLKIMNCAKGLDIENVWRVKNMETRNEYQKKKKKSALWSTPRNISQFFFPPSKSSVLSSLILISLHINFLVFFFWPISFSRWNFMSTATNWQPRANDTHEKKKIVHTLFASLFCGEFAVKFCRWVVFFSLSSKNIRWQDEHVWKVQPSDDKIKIKCNAT